MQPFQQEKTYGHMPIAWIKVQGFERVARTHEIEGRKEVAQSVGAAIVAGNAGSVRKLSVEVPLDCPRHPQVRSVC